MFKHTVALALLLALLAPQVEDPAFARLLPLPKQTLTIETPAENSLTIAQLLERLSGETGVTFSYETEVLGQLTKARLHLSQPVELTPEQAYPWIEGLLVQHGFTLGVLSLVEKPLVGVYGDLPSARSAGRPVAHYLAPERLDEARLHPALLVQTVIDLPAVDVRTLGNSLRGITGSDSTALVPIANTSSLAIAGKALSVANLADLLFEMQRQARAAVGGAGK